MEQRARVDLVSKKDGPRPNSISEIRSKRCANVRQFEGVVVALANKTKRRRGSHETVKRLNMRLSVSCQFIGH
jgi:hypothetical protein